MASYKNSTRSLVVTSYFTLIALSLFIINYNIKSLTNFIIIISKKTAVITNIINSSSGNIEAPDDTPSPLCYPIVQHPIDDNYKSPNNNKTVTILIWDNIVQRASQRDDLPSSFYSDNELKCSTLTPSQNANRCFFTYSRNSLKEADVVFVGIRQWLETESSRLIPPKDRPPPPKQYWVFCAFESPEHLYHWDWVAARDKPKKLREIKTAFDWTMSYRLDSTIPSGYGRFERLKLPDFSRNYDRLQNKTSEAVYMVSYCGNRPSHRDEYVQQLVASRLDVELIGRCSIIEKKSPLNATSVCARTPLWSTLDACTAEIGARYKFYLAFENSLCLDYVTEKFYRAASTDVIPVVMNGANMSLIAPPHSYIDAKDFESPRHLVEYLEKVGSDVKLYNSYFWWKPYYNVTQMFEGMNYKKAFCTLCAYSHKYLTDVPTTKVEDIDKWWVEEAHCKEGRLQW